MFLERPGHCVVLAIGLNRAGAHPVGVEMRAAKAADVSGPKIKRWLALGDPFGQRHTSPAARSNAKGVEPRPDKEIGQFRRFADDEIAIRREAFGAIGQGFDAGGFKRRYATQRQLHQGFKVIKVTVEQCVMKPLRHPIDRPWDRVGLIAPHHQSADFFLVIGQPIRVAQSGQIFGHVSNWFSHHILVLHADQRHVHAKTCGEIAAPLARAQHHLAALDPTLLGDHSLDHTRLYFDIQNLAILKDLRARHPRTFGQGLSDIRRVRLTVRGHKRRPDQIINVHQRPQILGLARGQQVHLQAKGMRGGGLALHFGPAFLITGQPQAAVHLPSGAKPCFGLDAVVKIDGIPQQLGDIGIRAQLPDQTSRMKRGARCQFLAL